MHTLLDGILTQHMYETRKLENMASSKKPLSRYSGPERCLLSNLGRCLVLSCLIFNFSAWFPRILVQV